eukprot:730960-Prymnesium_polylepis.1
MPPTVAVTGRPVPSCVMCTGRLGRVLGGLFAEALAAGGGIFGRNAALYADAAWVVLEGTW